MLRSSSTSPNACDGKGPIDAPPSSGHPTPDTQQSVTDTSIHSIRGDQSERVNQGKQFIKSND